MDNYARQLTSRLIEIFEDGAVLNGAFGQWIFDGVRDDARGREVIGLVLGERDDEHILEFIIKDDGFTYIFTHRDSRTRMAGSIPVKWEGDLDLDEASFMEYADSALQIIEDPDHKAFIDLQRNASYKPTGPKPQRVPLSSVFRKSSSAPPEPQRREPEPEREPEEPKPKAKSWRDADDDREIARLFPYRPKHDELLDLYQLAKARRSNLLMTLAKERSATSESTRKKMARALVEKLLENDDDHEAWRHNQRQYELKWRQAQNSAHNRPDWAVLKQAISSAMVLDPATDPKEDYWKSRSLGHAIMRYWEQYGGDWDQFLKDHPLQPEEAQCDNCGAASHHTSDCPYSFGANPQ